MSNYDWDPTKAEANRRKHGITFDQAKVMLADSRSQEWPDEAHSLGEVRIRTIGYTTMGAVIVVITSKSGRRPRIISARRATKRERNEYLG